MLMQWKIDKQLRQYTAIVQFWTLKSVQVGQLLVNATKTNYMEEEM